MSMQDCNNLLSSFARLKTKLLKSYKEIGFGVVLLYFTQSISWYEFASVNCYFLYHFLFYYSHQYANMMTHL